MRELIWYEFVEVFLDVYVYVELFFCYVVGIGVVCG